MFDIFENLPDYTLDEVDKKIDILDNIVHSFSDVITNAKDTLDDIDEEIRKLEDSIENYNDKIRDLTADVFACQTDLISLEHEHWKLSNEIEERLNDAPNVVSEAYSELIYIEQHIKTLDIEEEQCNKQLKTSKKMLNRNKDSKNKLIQSASNLLYSLNLHLNQLKQVQI